MCEGLCRGQQSKILEETIQEAFKELTESIVTYSQIFQGGWYLSSQVLPVQMVSDKFDRNDGDALIHITSYLNRSTIEMSLQEGPYIDNRLLIQMVNVRDIHGMFKVDNETHTTESVYFINATEANVTTYADLSLDSVKQCFLTIEMRMTQNETGSALKLRVVEVRDPASDSEVWSTTCLPNSQAHLIVEADTNVDKGTKNFMSKTSHFSFLVTTLAIVATFFTIAELKAVSRSLE